VKSILFIFVIIWFILGASAANDRGYFDAGRQHDCDFTGSALLTVVAGPLNFVGLRPRANC
jgi:hypothetical protein